MSALTISQFIIIPFDQVHSDVIDRLNDYELFKDFVDEDDKILYQFFPTWKIRNIIMDPEDDTNETCKYHLSKLYDIVQDYRFFAFERYN